ncbi:hypothetical protein [Arthrobacter sp. TE12232]
MSTQADALMLLDAAAQESPSIPWKLDWHSTISRIRTLIMQPELIRQCGLNVCGPAVFFRIWFARDPLGSATFAYRLLKSGGADLGPRSIVPGAALLAQDYATLRATFGSNLTPEAADWMLMSALRDSENLFIDYIGEPGTLRDMAAGITVPATLIDWLQATNVYSSVEVNPTGSKDVLRALTPTANVDVALLVNSGFDDLFPTPNGEPLGVNLLAYPNHYVQLLEPVTVDSPPGWIKLSEWSWGRSYTGMWASEAKFLSEFYGAVSAYV